MRNRNVQIMKQSISKILITTGFSSSLKFITKIIVFYLQVYYFHLSKDADPDSRFFHLSIDADPDLALH
jgi:hypothetical protein